MALTRITKGVIKPNENYDTHNINSTGIVTAIGLDVNGNGDISGNLSVGGVLTYEDVTSIDSVGIITARDGIHVGAGLSVVGIGSFGTVKVGSGVTIEGNGQATFVGVTTFSDDLDVGDDLTIGGEFNMVGSSDSNKYFDVRTGASNKLLIRSSLGGASNLVTMLSIGRGASSFVGNLTLGDSSDDSSAAGPEFTLNRNSASPANADYLGQIKFAGRSSTGNQRNYAKITGKILDVDNGNEDGILEFSHIRNGSQTITGRWRSDSLQLLNDTNLSVAGDTTLTGDIDVDGHTNLDNVSIAGVTTMGQTTISHTGANQLVIKDSDTSGSDSHMRISFQDSGGTEKFFVGNNNNNDYLYLGSPSGQNNNIAFRVSGNDRLTISSNQIESNVNVVIPHSILHQGDSDTKISFPADDTFTATTAGSERLRISSGGQIGITKTPKEWNTSYRSLQIHDAGYIAGSTDDSFVAIGANNYLDTDGNYKYTNTDHTSQLYQVDGTLVFRNAGAAGNDSAITWSEKLRITSTGRIGINESSPNATLHIKSADGANNRLELVHQNDAANEQNQITFKNNTTQTAYIVSGKDGSNNNIGLTFGTGTTERLRITTEGQVKLTGTNTGNHMSGFGTNVGGLTIDDVGNQHTALEVSHGSNKAFLVASSNNSVYLSSYGTNNFSLEHTGGSGQRERLRIDSSGRIIVREANTNPVNDFEVRRANGGGDVAIRIGNNTGTNAGSTASLYFTTSPTQNFNTAYIQAVRDGGRLNFGYSTNDPTVTMQISTNKVGITNTSPECRSGGIDMSSNDGTSGKTFTDMRGYSNLIIRNPNTDQHGFTQLLFENGGGTSAATMFRHRLGPSSGSQQNFVGDLCLFRRTGNAGGSNNDFRESTRWCGATEQARQIWWASGDTDTSATSRLGWHHLSASNDQPGTDAYTFFRLETGAAAYARNGFGKYTCVWTTGHASGYGIAIGHFGYYMHHGSSTIVVNEHIIHRERYSNGSYYGWNDTPNLRIINNTASGGTNAAISFRCGGRRSSGFDMGVVVGLFIDLYVPESANGDSNPRLYVAGDSESNLSGGGHGNPVSHSYMSIQSSNPNHSGQP